MDGSSPVRSDYIVQHLPTSLRKNTSPLDFIIKQGELPAGSKPSLECLNEKLDMLEQRVETVKETTMGQRSKVYSKYQQMLQEARAKLAQQQRQIDSANLEAQQRRQQLAQLLDEQAIFEQDILHYNMKTNEFLQWTLNKKIEMVAGTIPSIPKFPSSKGQSGRLGSASKSRLT